MHKGHVTFYNKWLQIAYFIISAQCTSITLYVPVSFHPDFLVLHIYLHLPTDQQRVFQQVYTLAVDFIHKCYGRVAEEEGEEKCEIEYTNIHALETSC